MPFSRGIRRVVAVAVFGPNTIHHAPRGGFTDVTTGKNVGDQVPRQNCPTGAGTPDGLSAF